MNLDTKTQVLDQAERAAQSAPGGRSQSEASFLQGLLRDLGGDRFADLLSPAALYRAALNDQRFRQMARDVLKVLGLPSQRPDDEIGAGDWILRAVPGTGDVGHLSVLASDELLSPATLSSEGIESESVQPGYYGLVIEAGAYPHGRSRPYARRLLDSRGRVPRYSVILRPSYPDMGAVADYPAGDPEPQMTDFPPEEDAQDISSINEPPEQLRDDISENEPMTPAHAGGAMGELDAAFALGQQGFGIIIGPGGPGGHRLTASGFDIVAFNPTTGQVWIVDNKASGGNRTVQEASAITINFQQNLVDAIRQVRSAPSFSHQGTIVRHLEDALSAVRAGRPLPSSVTRYVTNAGGFHSGISARLRDQGINFLDLTGAATRRARAADVRRAREQNVPTGRPTTRPSTTTSRTTSTTPLVTPTPSPRGAATAAGLTIALQGANFILNWLNDREQQRRVQEQLRQLDPAIEAERRRRPDHGILVRIYYHQIVPPPDSLIQPGAVFSHIVWAAGRTQDEARQHLASRPSVQPAPSRGSRQQASTLWISPLQPASVLALRTPFPSAGYGTFAPQRAILQDVEWGGLTGFDDEGTTRLNPGATQTPRFILLEPPSTIEWFWGQQIRNTSIPLVQRRTADGQRTVKAVDLDPNTPFDVTAVPVFPYDEFTDRLFAAGPRTKDNLNHLRQYTNIQKMRWVRPENILIIPNPASDSSPTADEVAAEQEPQTRFRNVFYDRESLQYLDGWTRAKGPSALFLMDRGIYDTIRADGSRRSRAFDQFVAQALAAGGRNRMELMPPVFGFDPELATVPLNKQSRGDWDDLMIGQLINAGRRLTIQSENDQWTLINRLFDRAKADARAAAQNQRAAREFAAYFVIDVINATLAMVEATNVTMQNGHAVIPLNQVRGTRRQVIPNGDAAARVIGDIHTHYLYDPLIDLNRSSVGTTIRSSQTSLHSGVSDIDVTSARDQQILVYAVDSKYLHRANPNGTKNDKLPRSGNVLREALRVFAGEPGPSSTG